MILLGEAGLWVSHIQLSGKLQPRQLLESTHTGVIWFSTAREELPPKWTTCKREVSFKKLCLTLLITCSNYSNFKIVTFFLKLKYIYVRQHGLRLPWGLSGKESTCQCRRHGFTLWSGEDPTCCGATEAVRHNF